MIDLRTPLSTRSSFAFPLQDPRGRRELLWGAALLILLPGIGWLLNMGHRIAMVHRMLHGEDPWPSWRGYLELLRHGMVTFGGMLYYYAPGLLCAAGAWRWGSAALGVLALLLCGAATVAIPGFMTHYCVAFDPREIYHPFRALARVAQGGRLYWRAWGIALAALALSSLGLLGLGVGFLVSSVWFWQVAGFSFASVFTQRYGLLERPVPVPA